MKPLSHVTLPTLLVLGALLTGDTYGLQIARRTTLGTGSVHTILRRLEDLGWVTGQWETRTEGGRRGPSRRYYQLTDDGRATARELVAQRLKTIGGPA